MTQPEAAAAAADVRHTAVGPVFMVRFLRPPDEAVADEVLTATEKARAAARDRLTFVGVVGDRLGMPSKGFRDKLATQGKLIQASAESVHFVIEGDGLLPRLQRAMVGAIAGVVAIGVPFFVHSDVGEALRKAAELRSVPLPALFEAARRAGVDRA